VIADRSIQVQFAYSKEKDAFVYHLSYPAAAAGDALRGAHCGGLLLDKAWHKYEFYVPSNDVAQTVSVDPVSAPPVGWMTAAFHPDLYFRIRDDERGPSDRTNVWLSLRDKDWARTTIRRDGDIVSVSESNVNLPSVSTP
jgi:hypothetical protein